MKAVLLLLATIVACVSAQGISTNALLTNDLKVLNYALSLEYLESEFYKKFQAQYTVNDFTGAGLGLTVADYAYFNMIRDHEISHVNFLRTAILGTSPTFPIVQNCTAFDFSLVTSIRTYIQVAALLENTGVSAYTGAANLLTLRNLTTAAATIATVEGRHAAYLNRLNGTIPFPLERDQALTVAQIQTAAGSFWSACTAQGYPATAPQLLVPQPNISVVETPNGVVTSDPAITATLVANNLNVLKYALFLEDLEAAFYLQFLAQYPNAAAFPGYPADTYANIKLISDHETAHANYLRAAIPGAPAACTGFNFGTLPNVTSWLAVARVLENTGVSAYDGAIGGLTDKDFITAAGTIATVEARHAAYLNGLFGETGFPLDRDNTLTQAQVVTAVTPYLPTTNCPAPSAFEVYNILGNTGVTDAPTTPAPVVTTTQAPGNTTTKAPTPSSTSSTTSVVVSAFGFVFCLIAALL